MKKTIFLILLLAIVASGCKPKIQDESVDLKAVKDSVSKVIDIFIAAFNNRDIKPINTLLADSSLTLGTDPQEIMNKTKCIEMVTSQFADTSLHYSIRKESREVIAAPDGKSAMVADMYYITAISPKIPLRMIAYVYNVHGEWKIYCYSWNFIHRNEDLEKLNKALE